MNELSCTNRSSLFPQHAFNAFIMQCTLPIPTAKLNPLKKTSIDEGHTPAPRTLCRCMTFAGEAATAAIVLVSVCVLATTTLTVPRLLLLLLSLLLAQGTCRADETTSHSCLSASPAAVVAAPSC